MKLMLHELRAAPRRGPRRRSASRPSRCWRAWPDHGAAHPGLGRARDPDAAASTRPFAARSGGRRGFQSYQYRLIEFVLGNKQRAMLDAASAPAGPAPRRWRRSWRRRRSTTRRCGCSRAAASRSRPARSSATAACRTSPTRPSRPAWTAVYRDPERHWDLYELGEELVDLEDSFRQWRFRHVTTVRAHHRLQARHRRHGGRRYLRKLLDVRLFPELWDLRTQL